MGVQTFPVVSLPPGVVLAYAGTTGLVDGWLPCDGAAVSRTVYAALFAAVGTTYGVGDGSTTFNVPNLKGRVIVMKDAAQTEFDVLGEVGGAKTVALVTAEMPAHSHAVTVDGNNFNSNVPSDNSSDWPSPNNTGWMDRSNTHYHTGQTDGNNFSQVWTTSTSHSHQGSGGTTSEQPWGGGAWATNHWHYFTTNSPDINHLHDLQNHRHDMKNHVHNVNHAHTGSSAAVGSGTAHNNLQPYMALAYLIKT